MRISRIKPAEDKISVAYRRLFGSLREKITRKEDLIAVMHQCGLDPLMKLAEKIWSKYKGQITFLGKRLHRFSSGDISYEDFCRITYRIPSVSFEDFLSALERISCSRANSKINVSTFVSRITKKADKGFKADLQRLLDDYDISGEGRTVDTTEVCNCLFVRFANMLSTAGLDFGNLL
ncbi:positive regulation of protein localization to ciliary membrane [Sparganum proliferum]